MGKFEEGKYGLGLTGQTNDVHKFVKDSYWESMKGHLRLDKESKQEAPEAANQEQAESRSESVKDYAGQAISYIKGEYDREKMQNPLSLNQIAAEIGVDEVSTEELLTVEEIDQEFEKTYESIQRNIQAIEDSSNEPVEKVSEVTDSLVENKEVAPPGKYAPVDWEEWKKHLQGPNISAIYAFKDYNPAYFLNNKNEPCVVYTEDGVRQGRHFYVNENGVGYSQELKPEEVDNNLIKPEQGSTVENYTVDNHKLDSNDVNQPDSAEIQNSGLESDILLAKKLKQLEDIQDYLKINAILDYPGGASLEDFLDKTTPDVKQEILQTVESWQEADRAEGGMHHDKIDPATGKYNRQFYLSQVAEAATQLTSKYYSGQVEQVPTEPVKDPVVENPEPAPEPTISKGVSVEAPIPDFPENQTPEQPPVNSETQNPPVVEQVPTEPVEDPVVENPEPAPEQIVPEPANVEAPVPASLENQTPEQVLVNEVAEETVSKTTETPTETSPEQKVDFQQALNETFTKSGYFDSMTSILHTLDVASRDGQSLLIEQPVVDKLTSDFQEFYRLASGSKLDDKSLKAITESLNDDFAKMQPIPSVGGRINLSVEFVDRMVDQLRAIGLEQNNLIQKIEQMDQSENHNKTADIRANMKIGLRLLEQKFVQLRKVKQSLSNYTNSSY